MNKAQNVIKFYTMCNTLKDVVRTGWQNWGVNRDRVESVAEHVYGVQMLAIAMWAEYKYDIDIQKVITMLAIHEVEEIVIGDLTMFQVTKEDKKKQGHDAVREIFSTLSNSWNIEELIYEFDERKTPEAQFAYFCDKLECDLQSKLYDEQHCVDLYSQENNKVMENEKVKQLLDKGYSWSKMWMMFGQERYNYDKNFIEVSNEALQTEIMEK